MQSFDVVVVGAGAAGLFCAGIAGQRGLTVLVLDHSAKVAEKAAVIDGWIAARRMAPVDATHLFFTIWAATQTYADFEAQVCAVLGREQLGAADHARATAHVVGLVLRGCGLAAP